MNRGRPGATAGVSEQPARAHTLLEGVAGTLGCRDLNLFEGNSRQPTPPYPPGHLPLKSRVCDCVIISGRYTFGSARPRLFERERSRQATSRHFWAIHRPWTLQPGFRHGVTYME